MGIPKPINIKPIWDAVEYARSSLIVVEMTAKNAVMVIVAIPRVMSIKDHSSPDRIGWNLPRRYTPAFTMAAECKNADTGVGATIALGSQI